MTPDAAGLEEAALLDRCRNGETAALELYLTPKLKNMQSGSNMRTDH